MSGTRYDHQRPKRTPPHLPLGLVRKRIGLTQEEVCAEVARLTGKSFTKGALCAIEKGHRGPSPETVAALEEALGFPPGALQLTYQPAHDRRKGADA